MTICTYFPGFAAQGKGRIEIAACEFGGVEVSIDGKYTAFEMEAGPCDLDLPANFWDPNTRFAIVS